MKKEIQIIFLTLLAMASIAVWTPDAGAFQDVSNCVICHTDFAGGSNSNAHQGHLGMGLPQSCSTCHVNVGDTPATSKCGVCHVEPGLPLHHIGAGAGTCDDCHPFNPPGAENDPVPGYAGLSVTLNPCDGSEERYSSFTVSLDNDGDGLYDQADPDCQPQVETNCSDGLDNDNDELIDCNDPDCANDPVCMPHKVKVCHKGKKTIKISSKAVPAHLAHGDTIGICPDNNKHNKHNEHDKRD